MKPGSPRGNSNPPRLRGCVGALRLDTRQRSTPEQTLLYRVLAEHLETLRDRIAQDDKRPLSRFGAELMKRVCCLEVMICGPCGGKRKLLAFLTDPSVIRKILQHLHLPLHAPTIRTARPPPQPALLLV